jgi:hypothetical protein
MSIGAIHSQSDSAVSNGAAIPLSAAAQKSLAKWLAMIAEDDFSDLPSIIAADAVFHSPVGLKPYPGHDLVCLLVRTAAGVFEDFKYHRKLVDGENAALEFSAHIGDVELKAVHLIRFNAREKSWTSKKSCARPRPGSRSAMRWVRGLGRKLERCARLAVLDNRYRYYAYSTKARQGEAGCTGRSVPMETGLTAAIGAGDDVEFAERQSDIAQGTDSRRWQVSSANA